MSTTLMLTLVLQGSPLCAKAMTPFLFILPNTPTPLIREPFRYIVMRTTVHPEIG